MNNKQEGFEENDTGFYQFVSQEALSRTTYSAVKSLKTKSKYKTTFKVPLTLFNNVIVTQAPDESMELDWNEPQFPQDDNIESSEDISSKIQPLQSVLFSQEKSIKTILSQQNTKIILQKVSDLFPKRFICVYNRFHENIFLKCDLTSIFPSINLVVVKNIARCLKLQLLKSIQIPFGVIARKITSNMFRNQEQSGEDFQRQKDNEKKLQRKSRRYESEECLKLKESRKMSKKVDHSPFEIQKSMILNHQVSHKLSQIQFNSNFESGNLHLVFKDKFMENLFYLFLTNDTNTHGFNQWFYFGVNYSGKESKRYRFVIMNVSKEFKYDQRMRLLSLVDGKWQRNTPFVIYRNKYSRYNGGNLVTLDFEYQFSPQSSPSVFFALAYPYTFTRVVKFVKEIKSKEFKNLSVVIETLGKTELTNFIPVVKIQKSNPKRMRQTSRKKCILVMARQHASQTPSSFICQSLVRNLLSQANSWQTLLNTYKFIIIPMANPDGVIHGNSRTNIKGYDINRLWQPNKNNYIFMSTETEDINNYLTQLLNDQSIQYTIDLHSHSRDYGSFVYCCDNSENSKLFRYFFTKNYPQCSYEKCKINLTPDKKCTFRGQMYHRLGIKHSYTIETSYYGFVQHKENQPSKLIPFTLKNFSNIANSILSALTEIIKHQSVPDEQKQVLKVIDQMQSKLKTLLRSNLLKGRDFNSESDSDPENEYLELKERRQIGQIVPQSLQDSQKPDKKIFGTQKRYDQNQSLTLHNKSLHMISKIDNSFSADSEIKKKRKRIYTSLGPANRAAIDESPKQSKEAVQSSMSKKFLTHAEKQIDFRNTLRRGFKMTQSETGFYNFRKNITKKPKQEQQQRQSTNCIVYPTSNDLQISCDNIRFLHENLFKGRIKVKSIKEQQYKFLKRMGKSELINEEGKNLDTKGSLQKKMISQRSLDKDVRDFLNIGKIQQLRISGSFSMKK